MSTASNSESQSVIIIGGGIIGVSIAYYLSTHPSSCKVTLFESDDIAGGASGRAGGLLAEWAYPASIVPLSWRLHSELAAKLDGKRWGYRILNGCSNVTVGSEISLDSKEDEPSRKKIKKEDIPEDILTWLDKRPIFETEEMAPGKSTGQVHPRLLTETLVEEAKKNGVEFKTARVTKLITESSQITGVEYTEASDSKIMNCTTAILAAGAWSPKLYKVPITPIRAHSIVVPVTLPARGLFMSMPYSSPASANSTPKKATKRRAALSQIVMPEIYPRPDETTYICGEPDRVPLPESTSLVLPDENRLTLLKGQVSALSSKLGVEPIIEQACFLPLVEHDQEHLGGPIIGKSSKLKGLIIATGHTAWGIMNSQATGKLVSEIVLDGETKSADISGLEPALYGI